MVHSAGSLPKELRGRPGLGHLESRSSIRSPTCLQAPEVLSYFLNDSIRGSWISSGGQSRLPTGYELPELACGDRKGILGMVGSRNTDQSDLLNACSELADCV